MISAVTSDPSALLGAVQSAADTVSGSSGSDGSSMFKDVLDNVVGNINSTDSTFQGDLVRAAAGELDNPHQLLIDSDEANISLQLGVSVRDRALEAYNSIISMQV